MNTNESVKTRLGLSAALLAVVAVLGGALLQMQASDEGKGGSLLLPSGKVTSTSGSGMAHCAMRAGEAKKAGCCSMSGKEAMACHDKSAAAGKDKEAPKGAEHQH